MEPLGLGFGRRGLQLRRHHCHGPRRVIDGAVGRIGQAPNDIGADLRQAIQDRSGIVETVQRHQERRQMVDEIADLIGVTMDFLRGHDTESLGDFFAKFLPRPAVGGHDLEQIGHRDLRRNLAARPIAFEAVWSRVIRRYDERLAVARQAFDAQRRLVRRERLGEDVVDAGFDCLEDELPSRRRKKQNDFDERIGTEPLVADLGDQPKNRLPVEGRVANQKIDRSGLDGVRHGVEPICREDADEAKLHQRRPEATACFAVGLADDDPDLGKLIGSIQTEPPSRISFVLGVTQRSGDHPQDGLAITTLFTSSAKDFACIFSITLARWNSMVFSLSPSWVAMALLGSPATMRFRT